MQSQLVSPSGCRTEPVDSEVVAEVSFEIDEGTCVRYKVRCDFRLHHAVFLADVVLDDSGKLEI